MLPLACQDVAFFPTGLHGHNLGTVLAAFLMQGKGFPFTASCFTLLKDGLNGDELNNGAKGIEPLWGAVMIHNEKVSKLDLNAMKANQSVIITLLLAAFFLNLPLLVLLVGAFMTIGALVGVPGFYFVYRYFLQPLKVVTPNIVDGNRDGPRFAQGTGAVCALAGAALLFAGYEFVGWGLAWMVIVLAGINLFTGFCAGCALYYWMKKIKPSVSSSSS